MKSFRGDDFDLSTLFIPIKKHSEILDYYHTKYTNSNSEDFCSHITLVYPFFENMADYNKNNQPLNNYLGSMKPFRLSLGVLDKFPDPGVLFLEPDRVEELSRISNDLYDLYPSVNPYIGKVPREEIHHHMTVAVIQDEDKLNMVESDFQRVINPLLPIEFLLDEIWLAVRSEGTWYQFKVYEIR